MSEWHPALQVEVEETIVDLAQIRLALAKLAGCQSYAEYRLRRGSLAQTPEAVLAFLKRLQRSISAEASEEMTQLEDFARSVGLYDKRDCLHAYDFNVLKEAGLHAKLQEAELPTAQPQVGAASVGGMFAEW
jgi:Zn-dependent oligopeptidase